MLPRYSYLWTGDSSGNPCSSAIAPDETALVGSTEVLLDGLYRKPEESKKFLEIMDKQLRNIQNLVSDMLRLAGDPARSAVPHL